ncbi:uncharacterized protein [Littorina saxatilis]|uniref:uncharacterized protein n=1 Tax=Littorina saxatilis TaxID=31220 RepID=UPI0038B46ADB
MALQEEVTQLYQYDPKDFEKTAPFVPASPFCKTEVHQHKNEAWDPYDNQLINQLKKAGLDAEVKRIVKVLDEWRGPNHGKVWISDTLPADLNLPLTDEDHPAENIVQAFFIGKNLPSFVLTLFNLQKDECGPDLEKHIHKYTVATLQELNESLLDFCHDRFAILGCTFDMPNFNSESLKRELERKEEECEKFYDGPINFNAKVFENMTKAAVLLQGTSCVTCYMPSSRKLIYQSILLDQPWRNVVHLLLEFLAHTGQTSETIRCKSALKMEVAILETACRVGRSHLVTIKSSSNAEVNDCVRKMNNKENCKLRLEPSDDIDGSFRVISQQSTIIFTKNEEGNATVTLIANQDTPVKDGMDMP